jgi:hypothetical protein
VCVFVESVCDSVERRKRIREIVSQGEEGLERVSVCGVKV